MKEISGIAGSVGSSHTGGAVTQERSAGDSLPAEARLIEVRVTELRQLFDALDPSPFQERDLDSRAAEFVVSWARELPRNAALGLLVHLDRSAGLANEADMLRDTIHRFFGDRATDARRRLRQLFRVGRISLAVGVAFLAAAIALTQILGALVDDGAVSDLFRVSVIIGGWVAMWRPIEIFLYDWWPIRAEARLFDRLATMPVRITYSGHGDPESWRRDWPAVFAVETPQRRQERAGATTEQPD